MHLDPIFTELLRNNELPSEEKRQEATRLRSQAKEDLLQIDAEIQRLQARREQVQSSIHTYNTILSPARQLLPDVLQEIFYHCIGQSYPILSATRAPLLLTRVCGLWRSVALSFPRIWTKLHIPLPGDPRMSPSYMISSGRAIEVRCQIFSRLVRLRCQAVKEWLDRSGTLPLSLSISYPFSGYERNDNSPEDDEVVDPLFQTIRPFASRWRQLELSMPFHIYQKLETNISLDNLSMLRYFKGNIFHNTSSPTPPSAPFPLRIIELPVLEALSLSCVQITMHLRHYPNTWERLTDICFDSPVSDTDLLHILKQCHNLITLDINIQISWVMPEGLEPSLEMVRLPRLETLKLRESGPASTIISAIDAPFLRSLHYRCPRRYVPVEHGNFDSRSPFLNPESLIWLISNAAPSLEKLSIDPSTFQPEHSLQCLRLATHVKELIIGEKHFFSPPDFEENMLFESDIFDFEAFTVHTPEYESSTSSNTPHQHDILLPYLESLEANGVYVIGDKNLYRMLTSRIEAAQRGLTSHLRRVKMQLARRKGEEDIVSEIVARARDVGMEMKLDITYQPPPSGPNFGPLSPSFLEPDC